MKYEYYGGEGQLRFNEFDLGGMRSTTFSNKSNLA